MAQNPGMKLGIAECLAVAATLFVAAAMGAAAERPGRATKLPEIPLGLDAYLPAPEENPVTPEKIALG